MSPEEHFKRVRGVVEAWAPGDPSQPSVLASLDALETAFRQYQEELMAKSVHPDYERGEMDMQDKLMALLQEPSRIGRRSELGFAVRGIERSAARKTVKAAADLAEHDGIEGMFIADAIRTMDVELILDGEYSERPEVKA